MPMTGIPAAATSSYHLFFDLDRALACTKQWNISARTLAIMAMYTLCFHDSTIVCFRGTQMEQLIDPS